MVPRSPKVRFPPREEDQGAQRCSCIPRTASRSCSQSEHSTPLLSRVRRSPPVRVGRPTGTLRRSHAPSFREKRENRAGFAHRRQVLPGDPVVLSATAPSSRSCWSVPFRESVTVAKWQTSVSSCVFRVPTPFGPPGLAAIAPRMTCFRRDALPGFVPTVRTIPLPAGGSPHSAALFAGRFGEGGETGRGR
jgi:hypothetical protein